MALLRRSIHASKPADDPGMVQLTLYGRDELYQCPECYFVATFGIPLTAEAYAATREKWGGHRIEDYALAEQGEDPAILERLQALGYVSG